ncbi:MAG: glycosyltransferase [Cellulosilyticaceae bacterium]
MTKKIVIWTLFNIDPKWANNPYKEARLTKEWIDYRMSLFMDYTCKSLRAQTNQEFLALIAYDGQTEDLIRNTLKQYATLPENIRFVTNMYAEISKACVGYDKLYYMRVDSDNMIHPDFVQQLHTAQIEEDTEAILPQKGYIWDSLGRRLGEFIQESPPFYTLIYTPEEYRKGKQFSAKIGGHMDIVKLRHHILQGHMFMVLVHKQNILNRFGDKYCTRVIADNLEKSQVLQVFCLEDKKE